MRLVVLSYRLTKIKGVLVSVGVCALTNATLFIATAAGTVGIALSLSSPALATAGCGVSNGDGTITSSTGTSQMWSGPTVCTVAGTITMANGDGLTANGSNLSSLTNAANSTIHASLTGSVLSGVTISGLSNLVNVGSITNAADAAIIGDYQTVTGTQTIGTMVSTITVELTGTGNTFQIYGVNNQSTGTLASFTNSGTILGTIDSGIGPNTVANGVVVGFNNAGSIGTLNNSASISANLGGGVYGTSNHFTVVGLANSGQMGTLTNSGTIQGDYVALANSGQTGTLTNSGTIQGDFIGLVNGNVNQLFGPSSLTLSSATISQLANSGAIIADTAAIVNYGHMDTITNTGVIQENNTSFGVAIVSGPAASIGLIDNQSGASIVSYGYAGILNAGTLGALTNEGFIGTGGEGAIAIVNEGGIGSLTNSGTVLDNYTGIQNFGGTIGTLTNSGLIDAGETAVSNVYGTNYSTISTQGVIGTFTNSGLITGGVVGLFNSGSIGSLANTNDGTVAGTIQGGSYGIVNQGGITSLSTDGSIWGFYSGIQQEGSIGTLVNAQDGWIHSAFTGIYNDGTIGSLTNNGAITADYFKGITNDTIGSIGTLVNAGQIVGGYTGVLNFGVIGTLNNSGQIYEWNSTVGSGVINTTGGEGGPATIGLLTNSGIINAVSTGIVNQGQIGTLTNSGTIAGEYLLGIQNAGGATIGTLTNSGLIAGGSTGIANMGVINVLTNSGVITGASTNGIRNESTINTLTNTGLIQGGEYGAGIVNHGSIGVLSNLNNGTVAGTITGYYSGIGNTGTIGTLTNAGVISGVVTGVWNAGSISSLSNTGLITGGLGGTVSGTIVYTYGVYNENTIGSLYNDGTITGGTIVSGTATTYGIYNEALITSLTNDTHGTVSGYIALENDYSIGSLSNSGAILGGESGVLNYGTVGTLTNTGSAAVISGYYGIDNYEGSIGSLVNSSGGTITGVGFGIANDEGAVITQLTNSGTIVGGGTGIYNNSTIGTLSNTGLISGGVTGIECDCTIDSIYNNGTIAGTDGTVNSYGIYNYNVIGSVTNDREGTISASGYGIVNEYYLGTLSNAGMILGTQGAGVWSEGTIESLTNTGHIVGGTAGVTNYGGTIGVLANSGTIEATGTIGDGVYNAGSIVSFTNDGLIQGTRAGVYNDSGVTISVLGNAQPRNIPLSSEIATLINSSTGTISGAMTGVYNASLIGAVLNSGVISGGGIGVNNQAGIVALVNAGTVTGANYGLVNDGSIESLTNTGSILDDSKAGLQNSGFIGTLTSSGLISGAVGLANTGGSIGSLDNSGTIKGTLSDALYTAGTIGPVSNEGVMSGAVNGLNIDTTGVIGTLTNSGLISAPTAINVAEGGVFGPISNTGTIAGNILNASVTELAIAGASGSQLGTLTGYTGGISASGIGQITSTAADVAFTGNLLLNDHINVGAGTVTSAGLLQVNNPLNITGNYEQSTPATLSVGVTSLANHGELTVSGAATVEPNGHVALTSLDNFRFAAGESFTLIDAPSAAYNVAGITASVTGFNGGYLVSDVQAGGKSDLVVCLTNLVTANCNGAPAYSVATTSNAVITNNAAGSYMGSDVALNKLANAVGALASTAQANRAGNQLLADPHNNAMGLAMQPTLDVLNVVTGHADSTRFAANGAESGVAAGESGGHIATWGEAFGGGAHQSGDGQFSGYAMSSEGLVAGGDVGIADTNLRVGAVFSYTHADLEEHGDRTGDTLALNSYGVLGYGSYLGDHAYVDLLAGVLADTFDTVRFIDFTGFSGVATGSHDGTQYVAKLAGGYRLPMGGASGTTLTPVWGVTYSRLNQNGYTESGGNGAALNVASQGDNSFKGEAGLKLERSYAMRSGDLVPELKFLYRHEFDNGAQLQTASFAADAGETTFSTLDVRPIENSGVLSAGVNLLGKDGITVSLKYSAEVASGYVSQGGALRVRWAF